MKANTAFFALLLLPSLVQATFDKYFTIFDQRLRSHFLAKYIWTLCAGEVWVDFLVVGLLVDFNLIQNSI
jgi:hypothetical protein